MPPEFWQLPMIPNEYGPVNLQQSVSTFPKDNYGLSVTGQIQSAEDSQNALFGNQLIL